MPTQEKRGLEGEPAGSNNLGRLYSSDQRWRRWRSTHRQQRSGDSSRRRKEMGQQRWAMGRDDERGEREIEMEREIKKPLSFRLRTARSIQELARKKFQRISGDIERTKIVLRTNSVTMAALILASGDCGRELLKNGLNWAFLEAAAREELVAAQAEVAHRNSFLGFASGPIRSDRDSTLSERLRGMVEGGGEKNGIEVGMKGIVVGMVGIGTADNGGNVTFGIVGMVGSGGNAGLGKVGNWVLGNGGSVGIGKVGMHGEAQLAPSEVSKRWRAARLTSMLENDSATIKDKMKQCLEAAIEDIRKIGEEVDVGMQCYEGKPLFVFKRTRMFRSGLVGFSLHDSLSHYYYQFWEAEQNFQTLFPFQDWWVVSAKVSFDQTARAAVWNSIYYAGWNRGRPFAHLITYGDIPVEETLLWVHSVELIWVTILSFYSNEKIRSRDLRGFPGRKLQFSINQSS
ncbi:hypothetical protein HHK36_023691 [Tetracentron sinense]|uniref:Uncharacterized protein n=1 Tax=Tetracentron sinense TaxID=13715 RepID=A0A834YSU6_TETSI|nr:hypothetical protein HHK36_023691 [Tetracentron sinense]